MFNTPCTWRVPQPFQAFAVRSEEARHTLAARAPWGQVLLAHTGFLDAPTLQRLAALGQARMQLGAAFDIDHAAFTLQQAAVPGLVAGIAGALQASGVLGADVGPYQQGVAARIDYLGACGAGFHNDVSRHWTACLFWNLVLAASDVEFVMPHAGVRLALQPGDLLLFDPAVPHGLCRPHDAGLAQPASFGPGDQSVQVFLSGELPLDDSQWAALGSPWLPLETHERRGALDLMAAEFDDRSGAVKQLRLLAHCMR